MATTVNGVALRSAFMKSRANLVSSFVPGVEPKMKNSDVSLINRTSSLVRGGMMMRNACGRMIVNIVRVCDMPSERAASVWPFGTASIPARIVSAM